MWNADASNLRLEWSLRAQACSLLLVAGNLSTEQGVDPGFDPVLNHMNYVYTQCQYQKGHFTDGQMITMVSKFGKFTPVCLVSRICAL